jgi:hypothetical protein
MTMKKAIMMLSVAALAPSASACIATKGEIETTGEDAHDDPAQKARERQECIDVMHEVLEMGCPPLLAPRARFGGDPMAVTHVEDAGISICGGIGFLVDADAIEDPEWVGTDIFQNSYCTVGCFIPYCQGPLCVAERASGGLCDWSCRHDTNEQSCRESVLSCNGVDPGNVDPDDEACGFEPSGGEDGEGSDPSSGG